MLFCTYTLATIAQCHNPTILHGDYIYIIHSLHYVYIKVYIKVYNKLTLSIKKTILTYWLDTFDYLF